MSVRLDGEELSPQSGHFGRRESSRKQAIKATRGWRGGRIFWSELGVSTRSGCRHLRLCLESSIRIFGGLRLRRELCSGQGIPYGTVYIDSCRLQRVAKRLLSFCLLTLCSIAV